MKFIDVPEFGSPEVMTMAETYEPQAQGNSLLVKVEAAGINRADILQREGKYPPPKGESPILGLEICGEVVQAENREWIGKRVFGLVAGGGYAEYCLLDEALAFELPANLSAVEGAAIAEAFLTAWQAMFTIGGLEPGHNVLIHAGASGVGTAAIQLAKAAGAKVFVTVGSENKQAFCQALGADLAINYKTDDFVSVVKAQVPEGINLVVDCIAGDYIARDVDCMAVDGRIVVLAMMGGRFVESLDMAKMLGKRLSISASTLRNRSDDYKAALVAGFNARFGESFARGELKAVVDKVFSWHEAAEAHHYIEENRNSGKVILKMD